MHKAFIRQKRGRVERTDSISKKQQIKIKQRIGS